MPAYSHDKPLVLPNGSSGPPHRLQQQQQQQQQQHASALPQYSEYVLESPVAVTAASPGEKSDYVFYDPVAFRHLEDDPCTSAIRRRTSLEGYELYLVEQWVCSRSYPTFVIGTYTGEKKHRITVSILRIPKDELQWSDRLRCYFDTIRKYAKPKETHLGTLMVTNLSSFPSEFTLVLVPTGDVKQHRMEFIVAEDLKQLGCSGRSALSLAPPTDTSKTKFYELYKTSSRIEFNESVVELVKLCQLALVTFETPKLVQGYADGLLCDLTKEDIRSWWTDFGTYFYQVEPNDGILGPTTVAALLGTVIGARNRLALCGAPVPKDAFDIPQLEKAIRHFQRQQRIERTGRLDRITLESLRYATLKPIPAVAGDFFAVPRAIRTNVVARAVGGGGDVSSVETTEMEKFVAHISGESAKFLWAGKLKKAPTSISRESGSNAPSRRNSIGTGSISGDDELAAKGPRGSRESSESPATGLYPHHSFLAHVESQTPSVSDFRKAVFKTVTGRMKDVASGISAGADYVRGRGTSGHQRSLKDLSLSFHEIEPQPPMPPSRTSSYTTAVMVNAGPFERSQVALRTKDLVGMKSLTAPPSPVNLNPPESEEWVTCQSPPISATSKRHRRNSETELLGCIERHPEWYPRTLSFSLCDPWVLSPPSPAFPPPPSPPPSPRLQAFAKGSISTLQSQISAYASRKQELETLVKKQEIDCEKAEREQGEVERLVREMEDGMAEVEGVGQRVEYELAVVESKIRDLEEAVKSLDGVVGVVEQEGKALEEMEKGKRKGKLLWLL